MSSVTAKARLFEAIHAGRKPIGIFISALDPASTEIMGNAGFDYVILDAEHGRMGRIEIENHVRAALLHGATPLVRVLENSQPLIQSMLDVGAQGIFVPHVDTADDARKAVAASCYSPNGTRGMCPSCFAGQYHLDDWIARTRAANENIVIIPIIESRRAVENINEIVAVEGIDIVNFGPGDLSADMGLDLSREADKLHKQWERVRDACRAAGKYVLAPRGFGFDDADILMVEMDLMLLRAAASGVITEHRSKGW